MGEPYRKFESETIGLSGLQPATSKQDPRDIDGGALRRVRRSEGHDEAQRRVIILRLIEFFEEGPSGPGDL
jgi:hypothetical protein